MLKSLRVGNNFYGIILTIIIGQLTWPTTSLPVLLGPAFLLGISPLLTITSWQYIATMLASALIGLGTGGYPLAIIIVLQFSAWYWAHTKSYPWTWVVSVLLPLWVLLWQQPERNYPICLLSVASAIIQLLLYRTLVAISQGKMRTMQEEHYYRQGADRLLTASTHSRQLGQVTSILQSLNTTMEQTYTVYQDVELLARTDPNLPQSLTQRLFAAAQRIHQNRLQLQNWRNEQERSLRELVAREAVSLNTICRWTAVRMTDIAGKNGQQLDASYNLADDTLVTEKEQFPLANLLLFICQQGLAQQIDSEISLRFSGYVAHEGMRIIITFAPKSDQPSGEWPELSPYDLSSVADYAEQLNASCHSGITSQGEHIYILELH